MTNNEGKSDTTLPAAKVRAFSRIASAILSQWDALEDYAIARQILAEGIRKIHDQAHSQRGKGKYLGHALWSKKALALLDQADGRISAIKRELAHEHVIPVSVVIDKLLELGSNADPESCEKVIRTWSIVAIVTRDENAVLSRYKLGKTMPPSWDGKDPWARYRHADVNLLDQIAWGTALLQPGQVGGVATRSACSGAST